MKYIRPGNATYLFLQPLCPHGAGIYMATPPRHNTLRWKTNNIEMWVRVRKLAQNFAKFLNRPASLLIGELSRRWSGGGSLARNRMPGPARLSAAGLDPSLSSVISWRPGTSREKTDLPTDSPVDLSSFIDNWSETVFVSPTWWFICDDLSSSGSFVVLLCTSGPFSPAVLPVFLVGTWFSGLVTSVSLDNRSGVAT